jgi:putative ATP-dependent endonuclease of the OLD family
MLAIQKFLDGGKLDKSYFFDPAEEISISVRIEEITDDDLGMIPDPDHRSRFEGMLEKRAITLVRRFAADALGRLRWMECLPIEKRFGQEAIDQLLKGQKPGAEFAEALQKQFPELAGRVDSKTNQTKARELIAALISEIPGDSMSYQESDLRSGIDNSVRPMLPDPIYIPGVKDLADDIKTKDSANFGKLLGILLTEITPELAKAQDAFAYLNTALNRTMGADGKATDNRLAAVKEIESTVERYVKGNFPKTILDIRIPPPELKTILSSAELWADDGVNGPIATKGDGLKRAITFAILRAYVELKDRQRADGKSKPAGSYLFLFEEPELFLHPVAQRTLFDALHEISKGNHVVVTTHSPLFFQPAAASTFLKMVKRTDGRFGPKPYSQALAIDINDLDTRAQFQLITYENSSAAFFCQTVVLVEGDSDFIVFPHIAKLLNPLWNPELMGLAFCRVSGKGSLGRYKRFFNLFDIQVYLIADLDCVVDGFEHLGASESCKTIRELLIQQIDAYIARNDVVGTLSARDLRDIQQSTTRKAQFERIRAVYDSCLAGRASAAELKLAGDAFFQDETLKKRRTILQTHPSADILASKRELLRQLRADGICLLEKGAIEAYYPDGVTGQDKPSRAFQFCETVDSREKVLGLCEMIPLPLQPAVAELELIFQRVFNAQK